MKPIDLLGLGPRRFVNQVGSDYVITVIPPAWSNMGKGANVTLNAEQFARYSRWLNSGESIQSTFPDLSKEDREILMSGIGPNTWNDKFPPEDE